MIMMKIIQITAIAINGLITRNCNIDFRVSLKYVEHTAPIASNNIGTAVNVFPFLYPYLK